MTTPTERGLFERIRAKSRYHAAKIGQPNEYRISDEKLKEICAELGRELSEAAPREESTRRANVDVVDWYDQINAARKDLEQRLAEAEQEIENRKVYEFAADNTIKSRNELIAEKCQQIAQLEGVVAAMTKWLEANQPDVFKRGMWDAITAVQPEAGQHEPIKSVWDLKAGESRGSPAPGPFKPETMEKINEAIGELQRNCEELPGGDIDILPSARYGAEQPAQAAERVAIQPGHERYRVEKTTGGFWPYQVLCGTGTRALFIGQKKNCDKVQMELAAAYEDGRFVEQQIAPQQPRAAVPEGWKDNLWRYGFENMNFGFMKDGPYVLLEQVEIALAAPSRQEG